MQWAGLSMRTFCILVIVGGAEHAQMFNFCTALAMMTSNSPFFQESN